MTPKQHAFVRYKLEGLSNRVAVIAAGYSPVSAKQMGTCLMKHPSVLQALKRSNFDFTPHKKFVTAAFPRSGGPWRAVADSMPKKVYRCPIEFLTDAMNCQELSIAVRVEFAVALLPYQHAKVTHS
jgi:hypothetical protein